MGTGRFAAEERFLRARTPREGRRKLDAWAIPTNEAPIIARHTGAALGLLQSRSDAPVRTGSAELRGWT